MLQRWWWRFCCFWGCFVEICWFLLIQFEVQNMPSCGITYSQNIWTWGQWVFWKFWWNGLSCAFQFPQSFKWGTPCRSPSPPYTSPQSGQDFGFIYANSIHIHSHLSQVTSDTDWILEYAGGRLEILGIYHQFKSNIFASHGILPSVWLEVWLSPPIQIKGSNWICFQY